MSAPSKPRSAPQPATTSPAAEQAGRQSHESLAQRYTAMAHEGYEPRGVDLALRSLDIAISATCLVLLAPLMGLIALVVRLTSGNPILYRGLRVGRAGRLFFMFKFRTLAPDAEDRLGPYLGHELMRRTAAEVTGFGRLLRALQLDELPQLWNVVRGDMSIVGPRPIRPAFFEELCEEIPQYWQRLVVRPGLTGFAQTRMAREETWAEKLAHDLEYIADRSVGLYLHVVAATASRILSHPLRARRA